MKSGQIVTGIINGLADQYETPDILQLLPNGKLSELTARETIGTYRNVFVTDRVVAQTCVYEAERDSLGRTGTVNHTVLYKFDPTTEYDGTQYTFDYQQFAKDARAGKYNFPMPPMPELKRPLDYPPEMDVQP